MHDEPLPLSLQLRLEEVCARFEGAWQAAGADGPQPHIADYLGTTAGPERRALLRELLRLDLDYRRQRGENPGANFYAASCPSDGEAIGAVFAELATAALPTQSATAPAPPQRYTDEMLAASFADSDNHGPLCGCSGGGLRGGLRYHKLHLYDKGGLGEVFVAEDTELHREVALKEICRDRARDPQLHRRFLQEAEITGRLEHPGIVPVYGMGVYDDGRPYYAMRLLRGETLKAAISRYRESIGDPSLQRDLALRRLLSRFIAVCNVIAYAHSRGVIHRDLKPANIILGQYGETWVIDWGVAKAVGWSDQAAEGGAGALELHSPGADTQYGAVMGTPAYMSPEQAAGQWEALDPASDVYGLGATLYCLLAGRAPVSGSSAAEVLQRARQGDWLPPRRIDRSVPEALDSICCKAMAFAPADRYRTAAELAADLERWLAGVMPNSRSKVGPIKGLLQRARGSWGAYLMTAAFLGVTVLVVAAGCLWNVEEDPRRTAASDGGNAPREPPGGSPASEFVSRNSPKDRPQAGEWDNLLAKELVIRQVDQGIKASCTYDSRGGSVHIHSPSVSFIRLGETNAPGYKLQIGVRQPLWVGGFGVYFGGQPAAPQSPFRFQLIDLSKSGLNNRPGFALNRSLGAVHHEQGAKPLFAPVFLIRGRSLLPIPSAMEHILELDVKGGGLVKVRWDGTAYPDLLGGRLDDDADARGEFGVFCLGSDVTVTTARFMLTDQAAPSPSESTVRHRGR